MIIASFKPGILSSYKIITVGSSPTTRSTVYVFNLFWDRENIVNRYDSQTVSVTTTRRGWFFR